MNLPPLLVLPPKGQLHCLELKREGERLTEDQEVFRLWCVRHGVPYDFSQVLVAFDAWSCLRIKIGGTL